MAIVLPPGLPAADTLRREGMAVLEATPGACPDGQPLRVALLNLMPDKARTETQFARLLGATSATVELSLFLHDSHRPRTAPAAHVAAFYERWGAIRGRPFDGLIVTGAPVETLPFSAVTYWRELADIFDWAHARLGGSLYVCWAAQAALWHVHGVLKHALSEKLFGVYPHRAVAPEAELTRGLGGRFPVPVSRHTEVRAADLPRTAGLRILADSPEAGLCLAEDPARRALYMFNHLEYDADTLGREYRRDLAAGRRIAPPRNYFPDGNPARLPVNTWAPYGRLLVRNWLARLARRDRSQTRSAA